MYSFSTKIHCSFTFVTDSNLANVTQNLLKICNKQMCTIHMYTYISYINPGCLLILDKCFQSKSRSHTFLLINQIKQALLYSRGLSFYRYFFIIWRLEKYSNKKYIIFLNKTYTVDYLYRRKGTESLQYVLLATNIFVLLC